MYLYKKIGKKKNITYHIAQNNANSVNMFVLADLSKIGKGYEEVVCWIDKSKNIAWDYELEHFIDKNYIKSFITTP